MLKNKYLIWQNSLFGVLQCDKEGQFVKSRFESAQAKHGHLQLSVQAIIISHTQPKQRGAVFRESAAATSQRL